MHKRLLIPGLAILLAGCSGESSANASAPAANAGSKAPATSTAEAVASLPQQSQAPFKSLLASYKQIHTALSSDSVTGVAAAATAASAAARTLEGSAADPMKARFASIATAAETLAASAGELTLARKNFGELSKAVIGLMAANPELGKGFVVVECPMTSNYKKWLQTDETVRNPHYGSSMLECGTISKLEL